MAYYIIRYIANKPSCYNGEKLPASGTIQYTRDDKALAEQILNKLYDISSNQKMMKITKRTRYSFRCENTRHKYLFKIEQKEVKQDKLDDIKI